MTALVVVGLGGAVALGVLLVVAGATGRRAVPELFAGGRGAQGGRRPGHLLVRAAAAVGTALGAYLVTGWPAGALLAATAAVTLPAVLGGARRYRAEIDRVDAVAAWAEMLRDVLAAASGLEQAVVASASVAPAPLAPAVTRLAARVDHVGLPEALRRFADEVDHPTADFVVAGLLAAADGRARELGPLLTQLASCARDEAQMRARVWAGRARTRTSVRVIVSCVLLFGVGLVLFDGAYLEPYDTPAGQVALVLIGGLFAGSIVMLDRMGRVDLPERFLRRAPSATAGTP